MYNWLMVSTVGMMHINSLELLGISLAVKTFLKNHQRTAFLLQMDNTGPVAYINNLRKTVSSQLMSLASSGNDLDLESRYFKDRSDWMMCPTVQPHL